MKASIGISIFFILFQGCNTGDQNPDVKISIGRDYERMLIDGYRLFRASSSQISIVDDTGAILVGPSVTLYSHQDPIIFGEVGPSDWDLVADEPGYFLIDTSTGAVEKGLSRTEWLRTLRKNGIGSAPELRKP